MQVYSFVTVKDHLRRLFERVVIGTERGGAYQNHY